MGDLTEEGSRRSGAEHASNTCVYIISNIINVMRVTLLTCARVDLNIGGNLSTSQSVKSNWGGYAARAPGDIPKGGATNLKLGGGSIQQKHSNLKKVGGATVAPPLDTPRH